MTGERDEDAHVSLDFVMSHVRRLHVPIDMLALSTGHCGKSCLDMRRLVSDDILRLVHGGARMVYVGKQAGFHTRSQEQIHELLCEFASAGHKVSALIFIMVPWHLRSCPQRPKYGEA